MNPRVFALRRTQIFSGVFSGHGRIDGDTRTITPDAPYRVRVALLQHDTGGPLPLQTSVLLAWTVSDAAGNYQFSGLTPPPENTRYAVIAYDPAREFAPAVKTHLIPEEPEPTP
jgi:hypothetical protein